MVPHGCSGMAVCLFVRLVSETWTNCVRRDDGFRFGFRISLLLAQATNSREQDASKLVCFHFDGLGRPP